MTLRQQLELAGEQLLDADSSAEELFKPYAGSWPIKMLGWFSKLGDQPELRTMAGAAILAGIFVPNDRLVRAGARAMLAHEAATAAKDALKLNVDRTRPRSAAKRSARKPKKGEHTAKERTSFPSGHSAGAIAAARAFSREYPEYAPVVVGAAALIAASQVPRCAHYPTDVAAGLAIGLAAEEAVNLLWDAAGMEERSVSTEAA